MRGWWRDLTDLVLPAECAGCGRPRAVLCPRCRDALSGRAPRRVRPVPEPAGLPAVYAAAPYTDEVRAALLAHKERGALALAAPLGTALAGAVRAALADVDRRAAWARPAAGVRPLTSPSRADEPELGREPGAEQGAGPGTGWRSGWDGGGGGGGGGPVLLVPVPSARRAVRARGHDPVRRVALAAAGELRRCGRPARVLAVLRQRRAVADQSGLDSRQRLANLAGALQVVPGGARLLSAGPVVVVDDLMTTGASLTEAARAVIRAVRAGAVAGMTTTAAGGGMSTVAGGRTAPAGYAAVYRARTREGMGERKPGSNREEGNPVYGASELAGAFGSGDMIRAAVVAASPDSFEMNWN
ncbi:ComF family protein [Streptomyces sp. NPDC003374]